MDFLLFFAALVAVKFAVNLEKYCMSRRVYKKFRKMTDTSDNSIQILIPRVKQLVSDAKLEGITIPARFSYASALTGQKEYITDLLGCDDPVIVAKQELMFDRLLGTYQMRMRDSISISYWAGLLGCAPTRLVGLFGGNSSATWVKVLQVVYWILAPLLLVFREVINELILNTIQKLS